jgi:mannosyltransferase OCH1-like enzyme
MAIRLLSSLLLLSLFATQSSFARNGNILDSDFYFAMTGGNNLDLQNLRNNRNYLGSLELLAQNYELNKPSKMPYSKEELIPKVMHHIWLGGNDIPPLYQHYMAECQKLHPNWQFVLWTESQLEQLPLHYGRLYDKSRTYTAKSDIARYEILYRYGGVYRDMDVKCYKPLDDLHHMYKLYLPLEYYTKNFDRPVINNGIIGASKGNHIMLKTLVAIAENYEKIWHDFDNENQLGLANYSPNAMSAITSMLPLTDAVIQSIKDGTLQHQEIVFPVSYFIPFIFSNPSKKINILSTLYFQFLAPETLMWHNFAKSEITFASFNYANGLKDPSRARIFAKLPYKQQHQYQAFRQNYKTNHPGNTSWSKVSRVPQVIHFVVFSDNEKQELATHLADWKMFNGDFTIKVWDKQTLLSTFTNLTDFTSQQDAREDFRFFSALQILAKFGGTYADFRCTPLNSIFELNNKYDFYTSLKAINNQLPHLSFSQRLLASKMGHPIIIKTLAYIDAQDLTSMKNANKYLVQEAYKWLNLGGKNIVMPAIYFEPIDILPDKFWYIPYDYALRTIKLMRKSLTYLSRHAIVK